MWLYVWLAITAAALIIEFCTNEMVSIWFVGGGLVALILSAVGVSWYIQIPVFIIVSLILLLSFRKLALKFLLKDETRTNADSAIDKDFTLLTDIGFDRMGTIKVNDVIWNVITENQNDSIPKGAIVRVKSINGNKYIVEQIK